MSGLLIHIATNEVRVFPERTTILGVMELNLLNSGPIGQTCRCVGPDR